MSKKQQTCILPFFIPYRGCPYQCIYCNQKSITGTDDLVTAEMVQQTIQEYQGDVPEVAFYGGSFTSIPFAQQQQLLQPAWHGLQEGKISGIRVSARPDYMTQEHIEFLLANGVSCVELGVQSLNNQVLQQNGRLYTAEVVQEAVSNLHSNGLRVGIQLMPGLLGADYGVNLADAWQAAALQPEMVRIYPTLVLANTPLAEIYQRGEYSPLEMKNAIRICGDMLAVFTAYQIPVIRIGLNNSDSIAEAVIAGPYHNAFGNLVQSYIAAKKIDMLLADVQQEQADNGEKHQGVLFVTRNDLSQFVGQDGCNKKHLAANYVFSCRGDLPQGAVGFAEGKKAAMTHTLLEDVFFDRYVHEILH